MHHSFISHVRHLVRLEESLALSTTCSCDHEPAHVRGATHFWKHSLKVFWVQHRAFPGHFCCCGPLAVALSRKAQLRLRTRACRRRRRCHHAPADLRLESISNRRKRLPQELFGQSIRDRRHAADCCRVRRAQRLHRRKSRLQLPTTYEQHTT